MKSNASASNTRNTTIAKLMARPYFFTRWRKRQGYLGIIEDDALDDVGDVLAAVSHTFEGFVDRAQLDHLAHVGFVAEQFGHGRAHHMVGLRFELVDFRADGQDLAGILHVG